MENKEIIKRLGRIGALMELHGENPFKIRGYSSAVYHLDKADIQVAGLDQKALESIDGIGKGIASTISEMNETGASTILNELLAKTPEGLIPLLDINGFGPKKIRVLWQELDITDGASLYDACLEGKIAGVKGFGDKLQEKLKNALQFSFVSKGKVRYRQAEQFVENIIDTLSKNHPEAKISVAGDYRRNLEIVDKVVVIIGTENFQAIRADLEKNDDLRFEENISGPFCWRGIIISLSIPFEAHFCQPNAFSNLLMRHTGSEKHLAALVTEDQSLHQLLYEKEFDSEQEVYDAAGLQYILPELRENGFEFTLARSHKLPLLVEDKDLKGVLHNHSTYSDGKHSLEEMATYCQQLGYDYLGISDHSKTAVYANGLDEDRIKQQHAEIDQLNEKLAPFKIFKGIESDILNDGSLDYDDDVLASFDFIVASIHSQLSMDINKATSRLLTAIANPFTTMLGHPTGRLLLKREGYPIDHKAIIDACAAHNVIIEINAHPFRLDLDWRWVNYAMEKEVMLSINPDAHSKSQYELMKYGVLVGRKGGLNKEFTFNSLSREEVERYFEKRKERISSKTM